MGFGFSIHMICGRIGKIQERVKGEESLIQLSVASKIFPKRQNGDDTVWYDMFITGKNAVSFKRLNMKKGDKIALSTTRLVPDTWKDQEGVSHVSLKCQVDRFWDARDALRMAQKEEGYPEDDYFPDLKELKVVPDLGASLALERRWGPKPPEGPQKDPQGAPLEGARTGKDAPPQGGQGQKEAPGRPLPPPGEGLGENPPKGLADGGPHAEGREGPRP
jgi:hypothetical protein